MSQKPSATEGKPPEPDRGRSRQGAAAPTISLPKAGTRMNLPRAVHIIGGLLVALCWIAWLMHMPGGDMREWGISAAALAQGRYETIGLHMFAHAGLFHIAMNSLVLLGFAGPIVWVMGGQNYLGGSLRFLLFYLISGLAGGALYVALNPGGNIPAVGASGAISGMIGFVSRIQPGGELLPVFSRALGLRVWDFVKANLFIIALFGIPFLLGGSGVLIAWEGHLGGFLFGLLAAGLFTSHAKG